MEQGSSEESQVEMGLPVDEHEEEVSVGGRRVRRRGIYLLPNLLTTGTLFSGFYAVVASMNAQVASMNSQFEAASAQFQAAALAIFVAMFFDGLDGRVARLTNTQSAFGAQYDSLSDMVAFGVAPALVMFSWTLSSLGKIGWAAAFIYVAGAALRLARFNTQIGKVDAGFFSGLASPSAAALLAATVWSCADLGWIAKDLPTAMKWVAASLTTLAGLLMVSNVSYYSFKKFDLKKRVPFSLILIAVLLVGVITADPPRLLLLISVVYAGSGPGQLLWMRIQKNRGASDRV